MQSSSSGLFDPNSFSPSIFIGVVVAAAVAGGGEMLLVLFFPALRRRLRPPPGAIIAASTEDVRSGVLFTDAEAEPVSTWSVSSACSKGSIRRWMRISLLSQQIMHWMSRSEEKSRKDLSWPQSESCCCAEAMLPRVRSLRPEAMAAGSVFFFLFLRVVVCFPEGFSGVRGAAGEEGGGEFVCLFFFCLGSRAAKIQLSVVLAARGVVFDPSSSQISLVWSEKLTGIKRGVLQISTAIAALSAAAASLRTGSGKPCQLLNHETVEKTRRSRSQRVREYDMIDGEYRFSS